MPETSGTSCKEEEVVVVVEDNMVMMIYIHRSCYCMFLRLEKPERRIVVFFIGTMNFFTNKSLAPGWTLNPIDGTFPLYELALSKDYIDISFHQQSTNI